MLENTNFTFIHAEPYIFKKPKNFIRTQIKYNWRKNETDRFIFMRAQEQDLQKNYNLHFESQLSAEKMAKYDFYPNNSASPVVNKKTLELLAEHCPGEFQAIPAKIGKENKVTKLFEAYNLDAYLINILQLIDCIDLKNCITQPREFADPEDIWGIESVKFLASGMQGKNIGRAKHYKVYILFSKKLVEIIRVNKLQGALFVTADELNYAVDNRYS